MSDERKHPFIRQECKIKRRKDIYPTADNFLIYYDENIIISRLAHLLLNSSI